MGDRINRTNFRELDKLRFSFDMTNHLNPLKHEGESLTAICKEIASYELVFPSWTRLMANFRIIGITKGNELFQYIAANTQGNILKWLTFSMVGNQISVSHFGPLEKNKDEDFDNNVDQTLLTLQKVKAFWPKEPTKPPPENQILEQFKRLIDLTEAKIQTKNEEFKNLVEKVVVDEESRKSIMTMINSICLATSFVGQRSIIKMLTEAIKLNTALVTKAAQAGAKQTAKLGAKTVTKGSAKSTAKAIPLVGLVVGTGLAAVKLALGDRVGAGMEFVSGALSCAPGIGTAASLVMDGCIIAKDVSAVAEMRRKESEALKALPERIKNELACLFEEREKGKREYAFVCELLGDRGYDFEKLERDIKVLVEVFS